MGQKVNPNGFRLGINRGWDSIWFAKKGDYGKYLIEDYKIRQFIRKNITNAGISEIVIERSSKKCIVFFISLHILWFAKDRSRKARSTFFPTIPFKIIPIFLVLLLTFLLTDLTRFSLFINCRFFFICFFLRRSFIC